ncbi:MAG: SH3 domain-containing protein [Chloroflexi bacterium]|nr:MAG: SH3 type 3 domain-containing protein [Chloroflexi bacterium OLB13]MBW7878525.1 SH3 domain-containing protein [Anaerolineae bacterium]MCC6566726.1 SH3 domain-containing protein [Chloroflexota bacterium]MEB2365336.1 SH3 domain-containing protein [Chloroflexota bacterium]
MHVSPPPRPPGLMPPLWSCAAVTALTLLCVAGAVAAFLALGGQTPPAAPITLAVHTAPPELLLTAQSAPLEAGAPVLVVEQTRASQLAMVGPTLPPVVFTPTPEQIAIGKTIQVVDVGDQQLNVRSQPGVVDTEILFRAPEGSYFIIGDGPSQADGLTWWRIDDPSSGRSGWAASNYLEPVTLP